MNSQIQFGLIQSSRSFSIRFLAMCVMMFLPELSFAASSQNYVLDVAKSKATWVGKFLVRDVTASMKFKSGKFTGKSNKGLTSGTLIADMNSVTSDSGLDEQIKGSSALDVRHFPTSELKITEFTEVHAFAPGGPNAHVKGRLTFHGSAHPVEADLVVKKDDMGFHATGKFKTIYGNIVDGEFVYDIWAVKKL